MNKRLGDTRQRIKDEAVRLFVEQGVELVSVRDIAAAVGMKAPNLYAHFTSRDELIRELFAEGYAEYGRRLAMEAAGLHPFAAQLEAMIRLICRLHDEDTQRFRFLLLAQHGGLAAIDPADPVNPVALLQAQIEAAMHSGELPVGDPALVAAMVVGVVVQTATFILHRRIDRPMAACADRIVAAARALLHLPADWPSDRRHETARASA